MKNGYVTEDHHGDNGTVRAGTVLRDLSDQRFAALEKRGLIREATVAEEKAAPGRADKAAPDPASAPSSTPDIKMESKAPNKAAAKPANKTS